MNIHVPERPKNRAASMMAEMRRSWLSSARFRSAKAELMALEGHMLKDIGLDRSEIESALTNRGRERRNGASPRVRPARS